MPGDIQQNVRVTYITHGANVLATLGQINSGLTQVGNTGQRVNRDLGLMDKQFMAMGTSIRYALAGMTLYGPIRGIQRLSDFETKLGDIDAQATRLVGGQTLPLLKGQMNELANAALDISTRIAQPVGDIEDMFTSLYSALSSPLPIKNIQALGFEIGRLARVSRGGGTAAQPDELISAMLGQAAAFNPDASQAAQAAQVPKFAALFKFILSRSRSIGGHELAQGMGGVISSARIANISETEMTSMIIGSMMQGGSATVNLRGLRALTQTLTTPRPTNRKFYRQVGLPVDPDELRKIGGFAILSRFAAAINKAGGLNVRRMTPQALEEAANDPEASLRDFGIGEKRPGMGAAKLITGLTSQAYSQRQLAVLASFIDKIQALNKEASNTPKIMQEYVDSFDRAMSHTRLQQASIAFQNAGTGILSNMEPFISGTGQGLTWISNQARGHPHIAQGALAGLLGVGLLNRTQFGRNTLGRLGPLGKLLGGTPQAAAQAALAAEAAPAVLSGIGQGTRAAPFWVIIHPDSWLLGGGGGMGNGPNSPKNDKGWKDLWKWFGGGGIAAGASRAGKFVGKTGGGAASLLLGAEMPALGDIWTIMQGGDPFPDPWAAEMQRNKSQIARVSEARTRERNAALPTITRALNQAAYPFGAGAGNMVFGGNGTLVLDLDLSDNAKKNLGLKDKRAHVQVEVWPNMRPKQGGKPRNRRSGK